MSKISDSVEKKSLDITGYSSPLPLAEPERAQKVLAQHSQSGMYQRDGHIENPVVHSLLSDPGLTEHVQRLCGGDLVLWRSAFFSKTEGSREVGWHHDKHFHSAEEESIRLEESGAHFSVLFGLTDITHTNGLLEVIPGSHLPQPGFERDLRPYHKRPSKEHFLTGLPEELLAERRPVPIPAGCFVLFHSALLHRSLSHTSGPPRLGLAIRLAKRGLAIPPELAPAEAVMPFPPHHQ